MKQAGVQASGRSDPDRWGGRDATHSGTRWAATECWSLQPQQNAAMVIKSTWVVEGPASCEAGQEQTYSSRRMCSTVLHLNPEVCPGLALGAHCS